MHTARLLLLLLLSALQTSATLSSQFADAHFNFCCHDEACRLNFELDSCSSEYQRADFDFKLETLMHSLSQEQAWFTENAAPLHNMIRRYRFCLGNEILEMNRGCVCRHDHQCTLKTPADLRLAPWLIGLLIVLATGFFVFLAVRLLKRQRTLEKHQGGPTLEQVLN